MLLGRSSGLSAGGSDAANEPASNRQEKLRKRQEKGDARARGRHDKIAGI